MRGLRQAVNPTSIECTVAVICHRIVDKHFAAHESVNHSKTFVCGIIHTNFAESYHSLLKRSIIVAHHHISEKHLPRYLREREFHWNRRNTSDGERTVDAIKGFKGKRLTYDQPNDR